MKVNLPVFPDGCGDCNGACCYNIPYGATPWSQNEISRLEEILPLEMAQKEREYRKNNIPEGIKITRFSPNRKCMNLTQEGLCGLHLKDIRYKPIACRGTDIGDAECLESRKNHGFTIN